AVLVIAWGIASNAERSCVLASSLATLIGVAGTIKRNRWPSTGLAVSALAIGIFVVCMQSLRWGTGEHSLVRNSQMHREAHRMSGALAAVASGIFEPAGNGGYSDYYRAAAVRLGHTGAGGQVLAPHNHFANVIMYGGLVGLLCVLFVVGAMFRWIRRALR